MATFQERLKELRKAHKLKQAELAESWEYPCSQFPYGSGDRGCRSLIIWKR